MAFFYAPQLTLPKVLLAMNTPASRQQAAAALSRLHGFVAETHNTRFTIEVLALQALLHHAEGKAGRAASARTSRGSGPAGWLHPFIRGPGSCLGRPIGTTGRARHCSGLYRTDPARLLPHFFAFIPPALTVTSAYPSGKYGRALDQAEMEVLVLLAERHSAKEIAQRLVISDVTAKKHSANIYQKLGVSSRREAVSAAIALGLLPAQPYWW